MSLLVSSSAFKDGQEIPDRYTCQGQDTSPPLEWKGIPAGTESLVLIVDDPDAPSGIFTHWVIFNIPATSIQLSEAIPKTPRLTDGTLQGMSDFGSVGYGGPCPPPGPVHHYQFTLYALDKRLELEAGSSKQQVLNAISRHILAQSRLIGTYRR